MPRYEYKVVPAPTKGLKAKGIKTPEARFSNAIQELMNRLAEEGWEYQRAEMLPSVERAGLASTTTEWRNVLVFRRPRADDPEAFAPELLPAPAVAVIPDPEETAEPEPVKQEPPLTSPDAENEAPSEQAKDDEAIQTEAESDAETTSEESNKAPEEPAAEEKNINSKSDD